MSGWETLNCHTHPDRIAIERCEVCHKPLCAYCLYYTEDGQRLCAEHAELARMAGLKVEEPSTYADQLIGAQVGVFRKQKRGQAFEDESLYRGNSTDLTGLIGLLVSVVSLGACCGGIYCLPLVGFVLSLVALINAKKAYEPSRARKMGLIGLAVSGVWVLAIGACFVVYGLSVSSFFRSMNTWSNWQQYQSTSFPFQTSTPISTAMPSSTPVPTWTPEDSAADLSAYFVETPAPPPQ